MQSSDGPDAEFNDLLIGAYGEGSFLRFVMRDYDFDPEIQQPERIAWNTWDVSCDKIVAIILRERTAPRYPVDVKWDRYNVRHEYDQTRMYSIGRGIECRLLHRHEPKNDEPFRWLQNNVVDPGVRFGYDTQENPLYGDAAVGSRDVLESYIYRIQSRADAEHDRGLASAALETFRAYSLPKTVHGKARAYLTSPEYMEDCKRWLWNVTDEGGIGLASGYLGYAEEIAQLVIAGDIPARYHAVCFYDNFPDIKFASCTITGKVRNELLQSVQNIVARVNQNLPR